MDILESFQNKNINLVDCCNIKDEQEFPQPFTASEMKNYC